MGLPTITQTWTHSVNNRYTFVSVIGATGDLMYRWTQFLINTMGWTVKGSNSTTGGAMDGVNRITSAGAWATRNNGAAGNQSWIVLTDGAGINWCYSFNSASDDIVRLAHSTGGNYVAAGTPSQQPTATDECFDNASGTWVNATASLDRVWHFSATSDKKMARMITCRGGSVIALIKTERFNDSLVAPATFSLATGGGTVGAIKSYYNRLTITTSTTTTAIWSTYVVTTAGDLCKVHTGTGGDTVCGLMQGGELLNNAGPVGGGFFANEKPSFQGGTGECLFPTSIGALSFSQGEGKLGNIIDQWYALTSGSGVPAAGDTFGSFQMIALGSAFILPWDGINAPVLA